MFIRGRPMSPGGPPMSVRIYVSARVQRVQFSSVPYSIVQCLNN